MSTNRAIQRGASVLVAAGIALGGAFVATPTAQAESLGPVPEYYQFCYDRTPVQQLTSKTGTTPKHWYKTAIARSGGVDCQYMYALGGFVPRTKTVYYSWATVCKAMGLGAKGSLDDRKIPHCRK